MQPERKQHVVTVRVRELGKRLTSGSFGNVGADHVALERPYIGQPGPCGTKPSREQQASRFRSPQDVEDTTKVPYRHTTGGIRGGGGGGGTVEVSPVLNH
jgi:hypothetical protein